MTTITIDFRGHLHSMIESDDYCARVLLPACDGRRIDEFLAKRNEKIAGEHLCNINGMWGVPWGYWRARTIALADVPVVERQLRELAEKLAAEAAMDDKDE